MIGLNQDLIVILIVVAFIFGAKKLPELGKGLGKGIQEFKNGVTGHGEKEEVPQPEEVKSKPA
jgi:sec-independent protein translocase protein TatA